VLPLQALACLLLLRVERISEKERKNGRSLHTQIQVRAVIFLILPSFSLRVVKKSASK
jgi:hypothetical protein